MLLLRANPASAPAVAVPISSFSPASALAACTKRIPTSSSFSTAARCSVGNLSPVRFETLRADADPDPAFFQAGAATTDGEDQDHQQRNHEGGVDRDEDDQGKKGGINVPRQRYIGVPKAALLDAALSLFPSQPAAAAEDFTRFARCLDAVLHAEHKETLEQMRAYYMLRDEEADERGQASTGNGSATASVNGKGSGLFGMSQDDGDDGRMSFLSRSLDWKTLLGLSPDPAPASPTRPKHMDKLGVMFAIDVRKSTLRGLAELDVQKFIFLSNFCTSEICRGT